eukprot:CAMPEP_0118847054 /NCGR_PEP_ID=MMETSP1162-20130426/92773_1 /TAXON_ID=33656 /ORGANISM="Phaeocystis Sp, Strain CCMP2710" /LENGTH=167 /DNA_ID=CAMNT_0006779245 /DNA_START=402 /DNA_END=906 /DNA_ORIENTATION=-
MSESSAASSLRLSSLNLCVVSPPLAFDVEAAAMKTSKALETPKAKAQGEVDYKAKIDVVVEAFSSKIAKQGEETTHKFKELKRKLEAAEDSDIVEQGKATLKSVKKELRLLQKAEEEHDQGESAVAAMVERLGEAHDEALAEIEEREKQYAALYGDGDDEILSSPGL